MKTIMVNTPYTVTIEDEDYTFKRMARAHFTKKVKQFNFERLEVIGIITELNNFISKEKENHRGVRYNWETVIHNENSLIEPVEKWQFAIILDKEDFRVITVRALFETVEEDAFDGVVTYCYTIDEDEHPDATAEDFTDEDIDNYLLLNLLKTDQLEYKGN